MSLEPDTNFGPFRLIRELGRGATGTVYLAEQTTLGRECALKVLAPELVRDKTFLERFRREGKIAASLRHGSIVRIFDLVECDLGYALAMDYIEGQELQDLLTEETRLPQKVALDIIAKVLEALDYAHGKGVVHRDIKPANIMIENDGSVFLTDFSIARMAGGEKLTATGTVIGTPEYMAPEQFDGKEVDARADVYATALILYELLSGDNPFRGETLAEIIKKQVLVEPPRLSDLVDLPPALVNLVHRGLEKSPEKRFQTACEMHQALKDLGKPVVESAGSLTQFLSSVELGAISMDDAVDAREKVKEAIDRGFKRELTIVMLDLAGSSKIKVPNQTLIADRAFQDYRKTINRILEEYGVERYDWSGDGAISLFAETVPAVDAAVMVQRTVAQVGARHGDLPDALKVRIGIRTGLVYYDPRRTLGEFASRTVDQAGHLEKDCPPGSIRLGDETVRVLKGRYHTVSFGKNRDDIEVFEIDVHSAENADREFAPATKALGAATRDALIKAKDVPPLPSPRAQAAEETREVPDSRQPAVAAPKKQKLETVAVGAETKPTPPSKAETVVQEEDRPAWWGWRSLGFLCFMWAGMLFINHAIPGIRFPNGPRNFFSGLFLIHLGFTPLYAIFAMATSNTSRAKEAMVAFCVFFFGGIGFLIFLGVT